MICEKCNASLPENAKFCIHCGEPVRTMRYEPEYREEKGPSYPSHLVQEGTGRKKKKQKLDLRSLKWTDVTINKLLAIIASVISILVIFLPFIHATDWLFTGETWTFTVRESIALNGVPVITGILIGFYLLTLATFLILQICNCKNVSVVGTVLYLFASGLLLIMGAGTVTEVFTKYSSYSVAIGFYFYLIALVLQFVAVFLRPRLLGRSAPRTAASRMAQV